MSDSNSSNGSRERELFAQALEHCSGLERASFLARACGEDQALRGRVEALLQRSDGLGTFLEKPVMPPMLPVSNGSNSTVPFAVSTEKSGDIIGRYKLRER